MSVVSFMEKLLNGDEVEWRSLEDIAHFQNAKPHEKLVSADGDVALLTSKFISTEGRSARWINKADVLTPALENDVALVMSDLPNGRALAKTFFVTKNDRYAANQRVCLLRVKDTASYSPKLLYYVMNRNRQLLAYDSGYDQTHLKKDWILQVKIPIPCPENPEKSLQIQAEIVRILDTFTELTVELTAKLTTELTARKKQYKYYRDKLLSLEDVEVEWKPMGAEDVGRFIRGGGLQKKDFTKTGVGCIHYGQIFKYYGTYAHTTKTCVSEEFAQKTKKAQSGDLVIATTSENDEDVCKAVAWLGSDDIAVSSDACIYQHSLNPKYVSYFFQTEHFQKQKRPFITGTKVRRVNADNLAKILIPIPTMQKQELIVEILDKFNVLTNSITESLPREIELRQKQYEYYRDLLLSFPKTEQVEA